MRVHKLLEGEKDVTGSLVVPHFYKLREGLNKASVDLRDFAPADSRGEAAARTDVVPCVEASMDDSTIGGRAARCC